MLEQTIQELTQAINSLVSALSGLRLPSSDQVPSKERKSRKKEPIPVVEDQQRSPSEGPLLEQSASTPTDDKYAEYAKMSIDQIRPRLLPILQSEGPEVLREVLVAIVGGDKPSLSDLPQSRYPELISALEEKLGRSI